MHLIEHTFSPTRLLLVWQAPEGDGRDRVPCVIGELRNQDSAVSFRYLTDSDDFRRAVSLGFVVIRHSVSCAQRRIRAE